MTLTEITAVVTFLLFAACLVQHSSATHHRLQAVFSMSGIRGHVTFTQDQVDGPTSIAVNLTGINETLKWSIHQLPMIYDGNAALSCSAEAVGELFDPTMAKESPSYSSRCGPSNATRFEACAIGDLGTMLGDLTANMSEKNYTNNSLIIPLRGPHSIMGRTLVFYRQDGVTPKACALITPPQSMTTAVAVFKAPVAGFVYLRQVDNNSDTAVYVNLFHVDKSKSQSHFNWQIDQGLVSDDFTDPPSYCKPAGEIFNPIDINGKNCSKTNQDHCPIGDMSSKHGNITVSMATNRGSSTKAAFTDTNLPLFGANTVIGKSIVLLSTSDPAEPVACAKILKVTQRELKVTFKANTHKGVNGYFEFSQASPFDPTIARISLVGLQDKAEGYHVHEYPNPKYRKYSSNESCSGKVAGGHWNPFEIDVNSSPPSGTGTDDEYEIGDLSGKYGSFLNLTSYDKEHTDYNLPLFGRNSIQGRSIVIHQLKKDGNIRWVCNNLVQVMDEATTFIMKTDAVFEGPAVSGRILIDQYKSSLQNVASEESTIFIDVEYTNNSSRKTEDHRWDVRVNPVEGDKGSQGCTSLGGNFNPFQVDTMGDYDSVCSPTNMLRCEVGDLSGKNEKVTVGGAQLLFNDINLALFGRNAVAGRGVAVRAKDSGSSSIGCTNIKADASLFVAKSLRYVHQSSISESEFAKFMASKLSIPEWRIFKITTEKTNNEDCLTVNFGIIGNVDQVKEPSDKLDTMELNNPEALEDYKPMKDQCVGKSGNGAHGIQMNVFSLAIAATVAGSMKALI